MAAKNGGLSSTQWLTVLGAVLSYTICEGVSYSFSVFYVIMLDEFQQSKALTALAGALIMGLPELIAPITGSYIEAFGTRVGACSGGLILATSYICMLYVPDITALCVNTGLGISVGLSLGYLSAMIAIERAFKTKIAFATGVAVSGSGLGVAIFPPCIEFLDETFGWRSSCLIMAGMCLNLLVAGATFQGPKKRAAVQELSRTRHDSLAASVLQRKLSSLGRHCKKMVRELASSFKQLTNKRLYTMQFGRMCVANFIVSAGLVIPMIFNVHAAELKGMDPYSAAFLMTVLGLASSVGQCALGWLATKWPCFVVYVVSIVISGVATALMPLAMDFASLAVLCAIFGFMYGSYHALMSTLVVSVMERELFTPAYAIYTIFQGIGDVSATPLGGCTYDWLNSYDAAFIIGGCIMTLPVIVLLFPEMLHETREWRRRSRTATNATLTTNETPPDPDDNATA